MLVLALVAASSAPADDATCKLVAASPMAVVVETDGDASRLAVDAIFTRLQARCVKLMPPALGATDFVDGARGVGAKYALHLRVRMQEHPADGQRSPDMREWSLHVEARVVAVADRVVAGVVDSARNVSAREPSAAVREYLNPSRGQAVDSVIAPTADQIVSFLLPRPPSSSSSSSSSSSAPKPSVELCAQLKALPLSLEAWGATDGTALTTKHLDDIKAHCAPSGTAYAVTLNVSAFPERPGAKASAEVQGRIVDKKWGKTFATINHVIAAPVTQPDFDALIDRAFVDLVDAVERYAAGRAQRDDEDDAKCQALAAVPAVLLVDSDDDGARTALGVIVDRLQRRCMKLVQPAAAAGNDPVDAARAVGAAYALQVHVGIQPSDKKNALIEGTRMVSYSVSIEARLIAATNRSIVADIVHGANVLGISPENAIRAATNDGNRGRPDPVALTADDLVDRLLYVLTATTR